jgi:hypothetical protein
MIGTIAQLQQLARDNDVLNIWTVYDHPKDFPHSFVARRFEIGKQADGPLATDDVVLGDLRTIRESFRRCGLTCIRRSDTDEPQIVECWL